MKVSRFVLILTMTIAMLPASARASEDWKLSSASDQVRWSGGPVTGNTVVFPLPEACAIATCDQRILTVALPSNVWSAAGGVQVSIRWTDESYDLDLYAYASDGALVAKSEGTYSTAESLLIRSAENGDYRILVAATSADGVRYEGSAEVEFAAPVHPVRDLAPDLISLPSRNLRFETSAYLFDLPVPSMPSGCYAEETIEQGAMRCLRFDQIIANVGDGPFELRYRIDGVGAEKTRDLEQRIYRSDGSYRDRFADTYTFHATHAHFHYQNFAQSHLWAATADGTRVGTEPVRSGRKNGFCMIDVEHSAFGERGDSPRTYIPPGCLLPTELNAETGALSAISGISVGWADVYNWFLPDQFIEVSGVPDGYYILENVADQTGTVEEKNEANNSASVLIRLCGDAAEIVGADGPC